MAEGRSWVSNQASGAERPCLFLPHHTLAIAKQGPGTPNHAAEMSRLAGILVSQHHRQEWKKSPLQHLCPPHALSIGSRERGVAWNMVSTCYVYTHTHTHFVHTHRRAHCFPSSRFLDLS